MNKNLQNGFILGAALQGKTEAYLPSGENIGDVLVWNGNSWEAISEYDRYYKNVNYIASKYNNKQYIDTGYTPNNNTVIVIDGRFTERISSEDFTMGCSSPPNITNGRCAFGATGGSGKWYFGIGDLNNDVGTSDTNRHIFKIDIKNLKGYIDDVQIASGNSFTAGNDWHFHLFHRNPADMVETNNYTTFELYEATIKENDVIIKHFIPCYFRMSGTTGLYETVESKFYWNDGGSQFKKGEDI